ncbi:MAG: SIS domain-containing protein [Acidimicrobiales bacterium]
MTWVDPDSEQMLAASAGLGEQVAGALQGFAPPSILPDLSDVTTVAVLGMGASSLAGEVLAAYAAPRSVLPVVRVGAGAAPRHLSPRTLLFAVSVSGDTSETLDLARGALAAGAHVVAVTSGGELSRMAAASGVPLIPIAGRVAQSRQAVGATIVALLLASELLGILNGARADLECAVEQLSARSRELEDGGGVAAEVARRIGRTIPLVHGAGGLAGAAARRWKAQVNLNAKTPAFFGSQPDVCHDEVCGFGQHGDVTRQILTLVTLRTGGEGQHVDRRFELFAELTTEALAGVVEVTASGEGELARFFDLMMIGDFVSLHLAAREGIDPGPVPALVEVKQRIVAGD